MCNCLTKTSNYTIYTFYLQNCIYKPKDPAQQETWSLALDNVVNLQTNSTIHYILIQLLCERNILST